MRNGHIHLPRVAYSPRATKEKNARGARTGTETGTALGTCIETWSRRPSSTRPGHREAHDGHEHADEQRAPCRLERGIDGSAALLDLCAREGLRLATDAIHYVSHWITPVGERRRFDTRFFVARAPHAQRPLHDNAETIDSMWIRPHEAIERWRAGDLVLMPPTAANIEFLLPHGNADDALAAAARVGTPRPILPKLRVDGDGRVTGVAMPDDPDYDALG